MNEFLRFYFVVEALGVLSIPIVFYFFRSLPDKGYSFSKVFSLVFVSYLLWILSAFKIVQNSYFGILLILLIFSFISILVFFLKKDEIFGLIKSNVKQIIIIEVFFLIAFAGATYLRSFVPDIAGTEKPFEFMLFNSVLKSKFFPPYDAWYTAEPMSYYYFGYVILSTITILAKVTSNFAFNLGISLTWALTAVGTFGIAYNFINLFHHKKINFKYQLIFILLIISFLLILSNFEGILELLAINHIGDKNFYNFFHVEGLDLIKNSSSWYPTEHWFWWKATRLASNWNVMEFPFFSFLLGDLHPHLLALPYAVTLLGVSIVLLLQKKLLNFNWIKENLVLFLIICLLMGAIAGVNTWFYPSFLLFLIILAFTQNYLLIEKGLFIVIKNVFYFILPIAILSFFSFYPLFATTHTSMGKILPNELLNRPGFVPKEAIASLPIQLFLFWGPLFLISLGPILLYLKKYHIEYKNIKTAFILAFLPILIWLLSLASIRGLNGLAKEIQERGFTIFSIIILFVFLFLSLLAYLNIISIKKKDIYIGSLFSLIVLIIGFLLILGAELFYISDVMASRYNTVFKFYFVAWILLSLGSGIGLYELWMDWISKKFFRNNFVKIILLLYVLIIGASFIYPVISVMNRTNGLRAKTSLDGIKFLSYSNPEDYESILWFNKNVKTQDLILESSGGDYSMDNTISAMTGLPTLIGWVGTHEVQIHGDYQEAQKRLNIVEEIYKTTDINTASKLLKENKIMYVYVSPREINKYGTSGLQKFNKIAEVVFESKETKIYKIK